MDNRPHFKHWVQEREAIRLRRDDLLFSPPWTDDPILRKYRFCNVSREHDKVTRWIHDNIRVPMRDWPSLLTVLAVARHVNWPDTLKDMLRRGCFDRRGVSFYDCEDVIRIRRDANQKTWGSAYVITNAGNSCPKEEYVFRQVMPAVATFADMLPNCRPRIREVWHRELCYVPGLGPFMAGQIVADAAYTPLLADAPDHTTWAPIGPGAKRGMNRWLGRDPKAPLSVKEYLLVGQEQYAQVCSWVPELQLTAHDVLSNVNCEVDKYLRALNGEGLPKTQYKEAA